jgi:NAD(P)H-flavin reductase
VLSKPPAGWTGEQGYINAEVFKRHLPPPYADHEYFICGPNVMMDSIEKALGELHVPISEIPFRALYLRLGESADAPFVCQPRGFGHSVIVILMSLLFALSRVASAK